MAEPTLKEAQRVAISLLPGADIPGGVFGVPAFMTDKMKKISEATTVDEVVEVLVDAGIRREEVEQVFSLDSEQFSQIVEQAERESTPSDQRNFIEDPLGAIGDFFSQPFRKAAETFQYDMRNRMGEDVLTNADLDAATLALIFSADDDVQQVIKDAITQAGPKGINEDWIQDAAGQDTEAGAYSIITQGMTSDEKKQMGEAALGFKDVLTKNLGEESFEFLSRESFLDRGIDVDLHENHDQMIKAGYDVYLQDKPGGEEGEYQLLYITPDEEQRAINAENQDVGYFDPREGGLVKMRAVDSRAPIGVDTGAYIDTGADINMVPDRRSIGEFWRLYGWEYTDVVTDVDFETLLRENVGLTESQIAFFKRHPAEIPDLLEEQDALGLEVQLHYQYLEGQHINTFIDMPLESFTSVQKQYEGMGIGYDAGEYGKFDPELMRLINTTMAYANVNVEIDPQGFQKAMDQLSANPALANDWFRSSRGGGTSRVWRPPAYLAPDYAELSQAVKVTFEQKLGRAPSSAEIMVLSDKMKADHRGEFDAQVEGQRLQFFGSGGPDAGTVQDVNYAARFQEDFESKYTDELGTIDRVGMQQNMVSLGLGSILSADRAIGY